MSSKLIVDTIEDSTGTYSLALGSGNSTFPGGIHIGGTGSANLLDDYEEGTWTPTSLVNGFSQSLGTFGNATYVKVGKIVHLQFTMNFASNAYASSYSHVGGLPFSASNTGVNGWCSSGAISGNAAGSPLYIGAGTSTIYIFQGINTNVTTAWTVSITYET